MTANPELSLGWVIVYVDDPAEAAAFYEGAFGLRGKFVAPTGTYAELDTGATKLAFAAYAGALEAGCSSLAPPADKPQGQRVAYVRDPFGTLVELATPL